MPKNITIILVVVSFIVSCKSEIQQVKSPTPTYINSDTISRFFIKKKTKITDQWTEVDFSSGELIEKMAYADTSNFLHQRIYPCARCFLRPEAAIALMKAKDIAEQKGVKLVIFDCYRPKRYQQIMYNIIQNPDYVAEPGKGSMHNKGLAVDIAFSAKNGTLPDFGSDFDDFSERAHFNFEGITTEAKENRKLLKSIMEQSGFTAYDKEWWHFNYSKAKYETDDFIWDCAQ